MSRTERIDLLILGLGNVLCRDDGLGCAAVSLLRRAYEIPQDVRVLDGGTLGLALLPYLEDARKAILVDAIRDEAPPGSFVRLEGDDVAPAVAARLSPHQIGVGDLLAGARWQDCCPSPLVLLGLVPQSLSIGLGCSPAIEDGMPGLVGRIAEEAARFGHRLAPKAEGETAAARDSLDVARILGL